MPFVPSCEKYYSAHSDAKYFPANTTTTTGLPFCGFCAFCGHINFKSPRLRARYSENGDGDGDGDADVNVNVYVYGDGDGDGIGARDILFLTTNIQC